MDFGTGLTSGMLPPSSLTAGYNLESYNLALKVPLQMGIQGVPSSFN